MAESTSEERVKALQARLERLKQRQEDETFPWWEKIVGVFEDCPEFEEAVRFGREWRGSFRPEDTDA